MQHKNFFIIPNNIFEYGFKVKEFVVYCCLLMHMGNNNDCCFPSRATIAKECNMDKKTVDSAIKLLIEKGFVKKVNRFRSDNSKTSNMYYVAKHLDSVNISSG